MHRRTLDNIDRFGIRQTLQQHGLECAFHRITDTPHNLLYRISHLSFERQEGARGVLIASNLYCTRTLTNNINPVTITLGYIYCIYLLEI